jgi:hypothetical protein
MRTHTIRTAVAGTVTAVAVAGLSLATAGQGLAQQPKKDTAQAPVFLLPEEMPQATTPWWAGEVRQGLPDPAPMCVQADVVPDVAVAYNREYYTDDVTKGFQVTVTAKSASAAKDIATEIRDDLAACAANWLEENGGGNATWKKLDSVKAEDGAQVYGVETASQDVLPSVKLFGVGRAGKVVTLVGWSDIGTSEHAPVRAFDKTMKTAVNKLTW